MDKELECDFYFGDKVDSPIKLMDYSTLKGYKKTVKNVRILKTGFIWQTGVWSLIFKPYKHYIVTGSPGFLSSWIFLLLAIPLNKKVYAWAIGMSGNTTTAGKLLQKIFFRLCNKVLLYGEFSKTFMIQEGFKKSKLITIYNSLDYENQLQVRNKLSESTIYKDHFKNDYPILVYIGRIQKRKKLDLLIKALKKLNDEKSFCNLVVIGPDVGNNDIPNLAKEYNLEEKVWFYGPSYDEQEIGNLLYNSDVCITPGILGLTAIHSLTYGTPVISNDDFANHGPEFEAVEPGITGDFFKIDDLEDLSSKISLWINLDPIKRDQVRANAFKTIDEVFNPLNQIDILKKLILAEKI